MITLRDPGTAIAILASALALAVPSATATDRFWIGPDNGSFGTPSYWSPVGVPTGIDQAFLAQPVANRDILFFSNRDHERLVVRNGTWTLQLGTNIYKLNAVAGSAVIIGDQPALAPTLTIDDGRLQALNVTVGSGLGSSGAVVVTNGAEWMATGVLTLGFSGDADVDLGGIGLINAGELRMAETATSTATLIADGASDIIVSGPLTVGVAGEGLITCSNGTALSNGPADLGFGAGSSGDVNFTSFANAWQTTGSLRAGVSGHGEATMIGGASGFVTGDATIADLPGSDGFIAVAGDLTTWSVDGDVVVGRHGTAALDIVTGAVATTGAASIGEEADGDGTAVVHTLGATWTCGPLTVGGAGTGALTVGIDGSVASGTAVIGASSGSSGTAVVDGFTATWSNPQLTVAVGGAGDLTITGGGVVTSTGDGTIGAGNGGSGEVVVTGNGSSWDVGSNLRVGSFSTGSLTVSNGGSVTALAGRSGSGTGVQGDITVTDPGSSLELGANLLVGESGSGTLQVLAGASVTSASLATIGWEASGVGEVEVSGAGSTWTNAGPVHVGNLGAGTLVVSDGGVVEAGTVFVNGSSEVSGDGTIDASIDNSGWVRPGAPLGTLSITGTVFTQNASGTLEMEIGGTAPGSYDRLDAAVNSTQLAGTLDVRLAGYVPQAGESFEVLTAPVILGAFDDITLASLPADRAWSVIDTGSSIRLDVVENDVVFKVSQWDPSADVFVTVGQIEPYQTSLSVAGHYSLGDPNPAQSNFPPGEAPAPVNDESQLFLLMSDIDGLVLVVQHDRSIVPLGGLGSGGAQMRFDLFDEPDGAAWVVRDDPGDEYTGDPGDSSFTSRQAWSNFSDGGAIGSLGGASWALEARFTDTGPGPAISGLSAWRACSANGASIPLVLEEDRPVRIEVAPALPCPADLTGDGMVTVDDLLVVLARWGTPTGDINGDGTTDVNDLLALLSAWGACG